MIAIRASLTRNVKALVAVFAALVIAMTTLTVAAPSANASYRFHCVVAKDHVRRGDTDSALCKHGYRFHRGVTYVVIRKHHHKHRLILKRWRAGHRGNALMGFRIKPRVPLGRVKIHFVCFGHPNKRTAVVIHVGPRRHHHH